MLDTQNRQLSGMFGGVRNTTGPNSELVQQPYNPPNLSSQPAQGGMMRWQSPYGRGFQPSPWGGVDSQYLSKQPSQNEPVYRALPYNPGGGTVSIPTPVQQPWGNPWAGLPTNPLLSSLVTYPWAQQGGGNWGGNWGQQPVNQLPENPVPNMMYALSVPQQQSLPSWYPNFYGNMGMMSR